MARILWHSVSPLAGTGYGQQTAIFTPRVRDLGHDVAISAYWGLGGSYTGFEGMVMYPGDEQWGNETLPLIAAHHRADLVITLMDVWVLKAKKLDELPLACWVPIDHDPCPHKVVQFFEESGAMPIAMSRFGARMLRDEGFNPLYVPHGIDTKAFRPRPDLREETRRRMSVPADAFVVGVVAANKGNSPSRKAFPQIMEAFARLRERRSDAYLFLHTDPVGNGADHGVGLPKLARMCGVPEDAIRFTDSLSLRLGLNSDGMSALYSAFDVLASPSYGEGFGIPIVEAQACGVPVVVTDWTAMSELCGDGWKVDGDRWYNAPQGSFWKCPSVAGIAAALEEAYERPRAMSTAARTFAVQYDADWVVREHWAPALAELGAPSPRLTVAA